jgi:hypothetical protein
MTGACYRVRHPGRCTRLSLLARLSLPVVLVAAVCASAAPRAQRSSPLTGGPRLARIYDAIIDARFEDAAGLIEQSCVARGTRRPAASRAGAAAGRAPPEACPRRVVV